MPIITFSCAWLAGIFLGGNLQLPLHLSLIGLIPIAFMFAQRHRRLVIVSSLAIVVFFTGAAYSWSSVHEIEAGSLRAYNDQTVLSIKGQVASDPDVGDKGTSLELAASEVQIDGAWRTVSGSARLFVPRYPAYSYGDVLLVTGKLETPVRLGDFDYKGYLASRGIYSTMSFPKIQVLDKDKGTKPLAWIYSLRTRLAGALTKALPEPQASLAQGILLGIRGNIPTPVKADFYQTGTTHILAISGMNLGILVGILLGAGIWLLGRRHYLYVWLALGVIWCYTLLTGMQPPVVRAAIMASVFLAAELTGRQRCSMVALTLAAAVMVGINPGVLWDASFQLSFMAMAGLVWLYPPLQALGRRIIESRLGESSIMSIVCLISDTLAVTLAATIAVWPLIAYYFGIVSLIGPLATLLVLPVLPAIIITTGLTGAVGLFLPPLAQIAGWLAWPFLSYMLSAVNIPAKSPLGFVEVGSLSSGVIWGYYIIMAAILVLKSRWQKMGSGIKTKASITASAVSRTPAKWILPPLLLLAILTTSAAASMPDDRLHVSFLDVGEGDAILIQKGNQKVLVDGGPSPQSIALRLGEKMPFWDRTIDLMVATHPHADHMAGLVEVLQRYQVKQVLYPDIDYPSPVYDEWRRLFQTKGVKATLAQDGQEVRLGGGAVIQILNVSASGNSKLDMDDRNLVLRLTLNQVSFLLTADLLETGEADLVRQRAELASTMLKVGHHGSKTSTSAGFLSGVNPQLAIVSVGADNRLGHPGAEVMDRLNARLGSGKVYRTDSNGTVEFITDGQGLWVKADRP